MRSYGTRRYQSRRYQSLRCQSLRCQSLRCQSLRCQSLRCQSLRCQSLRCQLPVADSSVLARLMSERSGSSRSALRWAAASGSRSPDGPAGRAGVGSSNARHGRIASIARVARSMLCASNSVDVGALASGSTGSASITQVRTSTVTVTPPSACRSGRRPGRAGGPTGRPRTDRVPRSVRGRAVRAGPTGSSPRPSVRCSPMPWSTMVIRRRLGRRRSQ